MNQQQLTTPTDDRFEVTRGPADLVTPSQIPAGESYRYGLGFVFQVGPQTAALCANLRVEGLPVGDFEAGMDVILFTDLDELSDAPAMPLARNEKFLAEGTGEPRIAIKYPIVGGFVPLGALRDDGTPHPHAGTGFGLCEDLDFPMKEGGYYDKRDKLTTMVRRTNLFQFSYDGEFFSIDDAQVLTGSPQLLAPGSDWSLIWVGLSQAIPDGDDLLYPIMATRGDASRFVDGARCSGVARWSHRDGAWRPTSFVPVVHCDPDGEVWMEPSLIRDTDGSLLFTARGCFKTADHRVRIWRSTDAGESWELILDDPEGKAQSTITLNRALDGTPYILTNTLGRERDQLCIRPLSEDRSRLMEPIVVRDALEEFGPPPSGIVWFMDHATAGTVSLGNGKWRHLLVYRLMDRGEHAGGQPPPVTGLYVEELFSAGPVLPAWSFGAARGE